MTLCYKLLLSDVTLGLLLLLHIDKKMISVSSYKLFLKHCEP